MTSWTFNKTIGWYEDQEHGEPMNLFEGRNTVTEPMGRKFDGDKPDYTLVPWDALEEIVKVLDFGAKKYERDNWQHVDSASNRYLAAAFRHLAAVNQGEQMDPESGLSHLAHAGCCVLFLLALEVRK